MWLRAMVSTAEHGIRVRSYHLPCHKNRGAWRFENLSDSMRSKTQKARNYASSGCFLPLAVGLCQTRGYSHSIIDNYIKPFIFNVLKQNKTQHHERYYVQIMRLNGTAPAAFTLLVGELAQLQSQLSIAHDLQHVAQAHSTAQHRQCSGSNRSCGNHFSQDFLGYEKRLAFVAPLQTLRLR